MSACSLQISVCLFVRVALLRSTELGKNMKIRSGFFCALNIENFGGNNKKCVAGFLIVCCATAATSFQGSHLQVVIK